MNLLCVLTSGDHDLGVGALINSLELHGFHGLISIGYNGTPPRWSSSLQSDSQEYRLSDNISLSFTRLNEDIHLARRKPHFLISNNLIHRPEHIFFADTDIVLNGKWSIIENFCRNSCVVVEHTQRLSKFHPFRLAWSQQASKCNLEQTRSLDEYVNSGFIGLPSRYIGLIADWAKVIDSLEGDGHDLVNFQNYSPENPWKLMDQAALNTAISTNQYPLSILDGSAMDFDKNGYLLSHAAGKSKPWRGGFVSAALKGMPPQKQCEAWLKYIEGPIQVFSRSQSKKLRRSFKIASVIGRFYRHPMYRYYAP